MEFRNPRFPNETNTAIDLEYNHPVHGWIPFTASPDDVEEHGRELFALAMAGDVEPFVTPTEEDIRAGMLPLSPRQLRLALVRSGISLLTVTAALDALPEGPEKEEAEIEWEYATRYERLAPALLTIASAIGLTPNEVDTLWATALTI